MTKINQKTRLVPDGNYGWIVVFAVALTNIFNQSLVSIFGLLFSDHLENLGKGTIGVALVMNLNIVSLNLSGLITGPAIKLLSTRKVTFFGSLLTGFGLILSSQTTKYWQLLISYGIIVGLGLGLIASSTFIAVNSYFNLGRSFAVGLSLAGVGFGQVMMPHIIRILLENYGFRGATLISGALAFHGLIGACLIQPVEWHMKKPVNDEHKLLLESESDDENDDGQNKIEIIKNDNNDINQNITKIENVKNNKKSSFFKEIISTMNLDFLKDPNYLIITLGLALANTSSINFSMIFPYFLQKTIQLNRKDTALCMSILATCDLISRLTLPAITTKLHLSARHTFLIAGIFLIFVRTILAEIDEISSNKIILLIICGIYGYIRSGMVVNQSLCISEYCGQSKLPGGLGINMVIKGLFIMTIGQVLGWVRDYTQNYSICLHAQNILLIVVVIVWSIEIIYKHIRNKIQLIEEVIID